MNTTRLSDIISRIDSFPTLPNIVAQVLQVVADPESTAAELTRVIAPDPAMTMSILKIANSAFLGLPKKVSTLQHAVALMGFNEIQNLVLGKAICQSFKSLGKNTDFDIRAFWSHSFLSGLAAKLIAADVKRDTNEYFVAGLIHDIGKLVIYMVFPQEFCRVAAANLVGGAQLLEAEKAAFGLSHDEVGLRLTRRWFLPAKLAIAAGFHHHFQHHEAAGDAAIFVHLADLLARLIENKREKSEEQFYRESFLTPQSIAVAKSNNLELSEKMLNTYETMLLESKNKNSDLLQIFIGY